MAAKKVLLVEGTDDEHVLKHICGQRAVGKLDEIKPQGSVEQLLENFPVRLKESEIEALGIVLDADTDLAGRWDSLKNRLKQAGYTGVPDQPAAEGTVLSPPQDTLLPRFGVGIETIIAAFLGAAVGQLYGKFPEDRIVGLLSMRDLPPEDELQLGRVVRNAKMYYANPGAYDAAWNEECGARDTVAIGDHL